VSHVRDVILRHGRTLRLRPPLPDDAEAVLDFFRRLDDQSLYMRFHGTRRIGQDILDGLLDPDWSVRGALIGILRGDTGEEVVAVASYARLRDPRLAEAAFAVATDLQGMGVGTRLVEQLAEAAVQEGIETFVADVMAENDAMLQVFADTGYDVERTFESGEIQVRLRIAASDRFLAAVDRRDHTAVDRSLESFFRPQTVAVIGAFAGRTTSWCEFHFTPFKFSAMERPVTVMHSPCRWPWSSSVFIRSGMPPASNMSLAT